MANTAVSLSLLHDLVPSEPLSLPLVCDPDEPTPRKSPHLNWPLVLQYARCSAPHHPLPPLG